jgi:hypothetical protein
MRFSVSALALLVLQNSSQLSPSDAFSPHLPLSRVAETSSTSVDARRDGDESVNNSNNNKSGIASFLLAGAALQLSTSKVSATPMMCVTSVTIS